ncbi:OsmC family protein [Paenibacillus abyssi]|nr:OsmC family protein [Paenibacillus abyssi]
MTSITITADSKGMQTIAKAKRHEVVIDEPPATGGTDSGPNPLQLLLCALAGCENIVSNFVAKEINFDLQEIEFSIEGQVDLRGVMGDPDVRPYYQNISVSAKVKTSESAERVQELKEKTDLRCPVFTTLKAAGVEMTTVWTKV